MRIIRWPLTLDTEFLPLPCHSTPLHVAPARTGDEVIDLWVLDPQHQHHPVEGWRVHITGTGHNIPDDTNGLTGYLGTAVMPSSLVWHIFMNRADT